jgi:hypothetical protein
MSAASPRNFRYRQSTFEEACDKADAEAGRRPPDPQLLALLAPKVSLEQAQRRLSEYRRYGAAASTAEALMYGLRDGIHVLPTKREGLRRLSELSADQLKEVCARLQNFKSTIARPWTADEVAALVKIWGASHA